MEFIFQNEHGAHTEKLIRLLLVADILDYDVLIGGVLVNIYE